MERKNFLKSFVVAAAAGPMILDACKKGSTVTPSSGTTPALQLQQVHLLVQQAGVWWHLLKQKVRILM